MPFTMFLVKRILQKVVSVWGNILIMYEQLV